MQEAALRIARAMQTRGLAVDVYTLRQETRYSEPHACGQGLRVEHLGERRAKLMEPLGALPPDYSTGVPGRHSLEATRCDYLLFHNALAAAVERAPQSRHVLLSLYATVNGYVAQQAAMSLGIPHIAAVRGSDFHRDARSPFLHQSLRFLAENADLIVTTNREQERFLSAAFRGRAAYRTIHNALQRPMEGSFWSRSGRDRVQLVADCGFSLKKATHLLIEAVAGLLDEGLPVELTILGAVESKEESFWNERLDAVRAQYPEGFRFSGWAPPEEAAAAVRDGDIHCSASLGEGCSNSQMRALAWGMPIVSSRTGVLPELAEDCSHVRLCPAGSAEALSQALRSAVEDLRAGRMVVDRGRVESWRAHFAPEREADEWKAAVETALAGL